MQFRVVTPVADRKGPDMYVRLRVQTTEACLAAARHLAEALRVLTEAGILTDVMMIEQR